MRFEWDERNKKNKKKHGVSFEEASEIFDDPFHLALLDKRFDYFNERWITTGVTKKGKAIVAGHLYFFTENGEEVTRIISARRATKNERYQYETIKKK